MGLGSGGQDPQVWQLFLYGRISTCLTTRALHYKRGSHLKPRPRMHLSPLFGPCHRVFPTLCGRQGGFTSLFVSTQNDPCMEQ